MHKLTRKTICIRLAPLFETVTPEVMLEESDKRTTEKHCPAANPDNPKRISSLLTYTGDSSVSQATNLTLDKQSLCNN